MVEFHKRSEVSLKGAGQSVSSDPINTPCIGKPFLAGSRWDAELRRG